MQLVYKRAAEALGKLCEKRGSLKYIIFSKTLGEPLTFRKRVYAVAIETLKFKSVLLKIIEDSCLLQLEPQLSLNLALVLLHDFFFGKGIQCGGPMKYCILRHKDALLHSFSVTEKETPRESGDLPRYARVNLLKSDVNSVIATLSEDGYVLCEHGSGTVEKKHFSIDPLLPDVLKFHPFTPLTNHPLHLSAQIILQDKASCLPAYLLAPPPGSRVIDCCAAPGNKTTHLAAIMRNKGSIVAFDKDPRRFAVLKRRLKEAGATCVSPIQSDILYPFLLSDLNRNMLRGIGRSCSVVLSPMQLNNHALNIQSNVAIPEILKYGTLLWIRAWLFINYQTAPESLCLYHEAYSCSDYLRVMPEDYSETEYILVDPSCSGSGIINRLDYDDEEVSQRRLKNLAKFQLKVLKHALRFPSAKRVLYSTCSIHEEENEMVVHNALKTFGHLYDLEDVLPNWNSRGFPHFSGGEKCLRSGPHNGTNGFFIAVFVRKSVAFQTSYATHQGSKGVEKNTKRKRRKRILPITVG